MLTRTVDSLTQGRIQIGEGGRKVGEGRGRGEEEGGGKGMGGGKKRMTAHRIFRQRQFSKHWMTEGA